MRLFQLARRDPVELLFRVLARFVVDLFAAGRSIQINPLRILENCPAIGVAQFPNHQNGARIAVAPSELRSQYG